MPDPGWTSSLTDVLSAPLDEVTAAHIRRIVKQRVRETDELDFKAELYRGTDKDRVELCKDIAALRNHRGGVMILGVDDEDGVASACPEVDLSDTEERRMRSIVASGTAPHSGFDIRAVEGETPSKGFYLLIAQPSAQRPHGVLVNEGLRYPRRDGTTTRYLSEAEVADMYRDRFRGEKQQIDRLEQITEETVARLDKGGHMPLDTDMSSELAWIVVSLVPNNPGDMTISVAGRAEIEQWATTEHHTRDFLDGFFHEMAPKVGVGVQRYTLTSPADEGKPCKHPYAAFFTDGSASAATRMRTAITMPSKPVLFAPNHIFTAAAALRIVGRHAVRNTGARGDAVIEARMVGPHMLLGHNESELTEAYPNGLPVREARSRLTLPLQSLVGDPQSLLVATRLTMTEIFNAFGRAEVPYIASDGTLRARHFPAKSGVRAWAERNGVPTTEKVARE